MIALHTWTLDSTPLADVLKIAPRTGWDGIELRRVDFKRAADAGRPPETVLALVRESGLPVACVGVELGWMFSDGEEKKRLLAAFAESCGWAAALGCRTVMSASDRGHGDLGHAARNVREVGDLAAAAGVRLAVEFNSQCEQLNRLEVVRDMLARASHPSCGLLLDTYHLQRSGAVASSLDDVRPEEIAYVQYSDVPASGLQPGQALDRLPPGRGVVPFAAFFGAILAKGYRGFLSYEAPNPAAWARPADDVAREAADATRAVLATLPPAARR
jgi:sugar phosphate isomerase/epimerase